MDAIRNGNFTSSEIYRLLSKKKGAREEYILECNMERNLGRALSKEESAKPLSWGKLVEARAFELLGLEYKLSSQETFTHPRIKYWAGSPDGNKFDEGKTVIDIKCPITLKSFCQLVDPLYGKPDAITGLMAMEIIRDEHKDGEKYYWQLVSNAILTDSKYAELIVYVPYKSELNAIRELANNFEGDQNKVAWINWASDEELPYLNDGGYYKNLNIIRFEVPQEDKDLLAETVLKAGKELIETPQLQTA